MKQVNDLLDFDIDTPSNERLKELFEADQRAIQAELEQRHKPSPPEYRGSASKHHVANNAQKKRKAKRKAQRKARCRA